MAHEGTEPSRAAGLSNTWPGRSSPTWTGIPSHIAETVLDAGWSERADGPPRVTLWKGRRLALLVLLALLGCLAVASLIHALSGSAHIDARWRADAQGRIELAASAEPAAASKKVSVWAATCLRCAPGTSAFSLSSRFCAHVPIDIASPRSG